MNWELRTVLVVMLDFLVPATVLGMVGPVVAKMAVEQAREKPAARSATSTSGERSARSPAPSSAGSSSCIWPTTSTIVILVAAALALLAAALIRPTGRPGHGSDRRIIAGPGLDQPARELVEVGAVDLGLLPVELPGGRPATPAVLFWAIVGLIELSQRRRADDALVAATARLRRTSRARTAPAQPDRPGHARLRGEPWHSWPSRWSPAVWFSAHLGSSIYGWTSVIGVLLAGLSFGNFLGGKIADFVNNEKQASWLFLAASVLTLSVLLLETQPKWFAEMFLGGETKSFLSQAISLSQARRWGATTIPDELALPDPVRRHAGLLSARPVAGHGQPGRGQAGGRPAEELQANGNSNRPGLRLGNGRQHPRHLS